MADMETAPFPAPGSSPSPIGDVNECARWSNERLDAQPSERLEAEACSLASAIAAVTCRWLLVVGELDRRESWRSWGCRGMSHWLSWKCGMALTTARHHLEVARTLSELPKIRARFGAGTLSFSKVRALCRVATVDTEAALIDLADAGTAAQLERMLRAYEVALRAGDASTAEEHRGVRFCGPRGDGTMAIRIDATPELYEALRTRVAEIGASIPKECVEGALDPTAARNHDALERLVTGPEPAELVINLHVQLADLEQHREGGPAEPPRASETCGGGAPVDAPSESDAIWARHDIGLGASSDAQLLPPRHVSPAMAQLLRRISGDARVRLVIDDAGSALDMGRTSRDPSRRLRRYVLHRDRNRCRFAGCDRRAEQVHHIRPWIDGGPTDRANLAALCRYHHRLVHPGGWWITGDPQISEGLEFHAPDGRCFGEGIPPLQPARVAPARFVEVPAGEGVDARHPGPMQLDLAVDALVRLLLPREQWDLRGLRAARRCSRSPVDARAA